MNLKRFLGPKDSIKSLATVLHETFHNALPQDGHEVAISFLLGKEEVLSSSKFIDFWKKIVSSPKKSDLNGNTRSNYFRKIIKYLTNDYAFTNTPEFLAVSAEALAVNPHDLNYKHYAVERETQMRVLGLLCAFESQAHFCDQKMLDLLWKISEIHHMQKGGLIKEQFNEMLNKVTQEIEQYSQEVKTGKPQEQNLEVAKYAQEFRELVEKSNFKHDFYRQISFCLLAAAVFLPVGIFAKSASLKK